MRLPVVNVWFHSPAKELPLVTTDFSICGKLCFDHLIERGFRRVGWITLRGLRDNAVQANTMKALCRQNGCEFEVLTLSRNYGKTADDWRKMHQQLGSWLDRLTTPIGLVAAEEILARILMQLCAERGLHVPQDVAIIAGWNEVTMCEKVTPQLTSLDAGMERIGYEAARLLDRLMDGQGVPNDPVLLEPVGIVARESTDFYAVEDELVAEALRFISDHMAEPIGVDEIATAISAAPRTLQRAFQQQLGRGVGAEVRRLRITVA